MGNYIKNLNIDFSVPEYLEMAIEEYLYAKEYKKFRDCEATELSLCLRDAVKFNEITEEQKQVLIEKLTQENKLK